MKKISELINLKNRSVLITGGAGHIGSTVAEALMELGAKVVLLDVDEKACQKKSKELNAKGFKFKAYPLAVDISNERETRAAVHQAAKLLGGIDIIIHTAAFVGTTNYPGWCVDFKDQTLDAWDAALRVNLGAAFVIVQEAKKYLDRSKHASVILVSSIYGLVGPDMRLYEGTDMKHPGAYGASKAGLLQLMRFLSTTLAPKIRVNAITPGGVWRNQNEKFHKRYKERTPLKRMATEEDLVGAFVYLASDLSSYVTGHNLVVDGGWTAW